MVKKLILILLLVLLGLIFFKGCVLFQRNPAKTLQKIKDDALTFDVIVVPGVPYDGEAWDSIMKTRVIWSWVLYKNGIAKNIIYSGGAVYTPYKESVIMGLYGKELGISSDHIFHDTLARHSTENVYYSYLLAQQLGFKSIALTSDPVQSSMLKSYTKRRFTSTVHHVPFVMDSVKKYAHLNPSIDATAAQPLNFVSIEKTENWRQRFRGTLGKQIPWHEYPKGRVGPL